MPKNVKILESFIDFIFLSAGNFDKRRFLITFEPFSRINIITTISRNFCAR